MKEEWKDIEEHYGYKISSKGRLIYKNQYVKIHIIARDTKVAYISREGKLLTLYIEDLLHKYFNIGYKPLTSKPSFRKRRKKRRCCGN